MTAPKYGPAILIDMGGTMFDRQSSSPIRAAREYLRTIDPSKESFLEIELPRAVFLAPSPAASVARIKQQIEISDSQETVLLERLDPKSDAYMLKDGAVSLLREASRRGWRLIGVTNTVSWGPQVPDEIASSLESIFDPIQLGAVKQDPDFWRRACEASNCVNAVCLSIGDSFQADVAAPHRAGIAALQVAPQSGLSLADVQAALPDVTTLSNHQDVKLLAGLVRSWGAQRVIDIPEGTNWLASQSRCQVDLTSASTKGRATLSRRNCQCPAVLISDHPVGELIIATMRRRSELREKRLPRDFEAAMVAHDLSLSEIDPPTRRQFIGMVREAKSPEIRKRRIEDIISLLRGFDA